MPREWLNSPGRIYSPSCPAPAHIVSQDLAWKLSRIGDKNWTAGNPSYIDTPLSLRFLFMFGKSLGLRWRNQLRKIWHHEYPSCQRGGSLGLWLCCCPLSKTLKKCECQAAELNLQTSLHVSAELQMPRVFMLHASLLNCATFSTSAITIITNQRGWRHSPCVCWFPGGTFLSWPGRKWEAPERRGTAKQDSQRGLRRGRLQSRGLFCHSGLAGASGATWTPASVQPHISPFFARLHPLGSVTGPSTSMSHGQSEDDTSSRPLRGINSVFHLLPSSFSSLSLSPSPSHPTSNHLYCCCSSVLSVLSLLSLPLWGISNSVKTWQ